MHLNISRNHPSSIPTQIAAEIRAAVANGTLAPGDAVPSTRALAQQLDISRGSVITAYDQLEGEGYLLTRQGAPTRIHPELTVTERPKTAVQSGLSRKVARPRISLKPSPGNAGAIRPATWRKAWREAAKHPGTDVDNAGEPELRSAIADHLRLARSMALTPDQIVITGGSREGLMCILHSLGTGLRVGVEDPGHPGLRRVIPLLGHEVVDCVTDGDGVVVHALPDDLDALLVTPSHLYPFGAAMPVPRRAELLEWAANTRTTIIEDDFNTELRYRISPQPTLSSLATNADVLTLGTFSTLLSRELAAGYVVASAATAASLREIRSILGVPVSTVTQRAIAHLLDDGVARRTSRAVHRDLARRRDILREHIVPLLNDAGVRAELVPGDGSDLTLRFRQPSERDQFEARLLAAGLECGHESALWTNAGDALVLSFAHLRGADFEQSISFIAREVSMLVRAQNATGGDSNG
ncbi:PLP-dependent aminotransferase family protein [Corynebacterium fournieri]|uniref:MocR-like pyridoxine biosynthesis transcription factor PdxR n=1 Tax=Corynebacterium fournieri TaxID=1852390 RepID=UPI000A2F55DF|nr:PLP-dependent aminotransferase family protein [Corynebacterium fournieri]WJY97574.1 HTH-type transcriptional regulatory protein GabR [Corynebacterium fournieri]